MSCTPHFLRRRRLEALVFSQIELRTPAKMTSYAPECTLIAAHGPFTERERRYSPRCGFILDGLRGSEALVRAHCELFQPNLQFHLCHRLSSDHPSLLQRRKRHHQASNRPHTRSTARRYHARGERLRKTRRSRNGHYTSIRRVASVIFPAKMKITTSPHSRDRCLKSFLALHDLTVRKHRWPIIGSMFM